LIQNTLKLTYSKVQLKKFPREGPESPLKGEGNGLGEWGRGGAQGFKGSKGGLS